jgi:hypothetical protein
MRLAIFATLLAAGAAHAGDFDFMTLGNLGEGSKVKLNKTFILPANTTEILFGQSVVDEAAGTMVSHYCSIDYESSPRLRRLELGRELEVTSVDEDEDSTTLNFGEALSMNCRKAQFGEFDRMVNLRAVTLNQIYNEFSSTSSDPLLVFEAGISLPEVTFIPATPIDFAIDDGESSEEPAPASGEQASDAADAAAAAA